MIPHVETVISRAGNTILHSTVRPATEAEITEAANKFKATGRCDHRIVVDEPAYEQLCHTCGAGLGVV